jgi:hypothetical protein
VSAARHACWLLGGSIALLAGALGAAVSLAGCGADFDPGSRVVGTRVLAVQADRPYAHPGEQVALSALAYDTQGRPLEWAWTTCVDPISTAVPACLLAIGQEIARGAPPPFQAGTASSATVTVPSDALSRLPESARGSAYMGVLIVTCPGHIDLGGNTGELPLACVDASGRALALDEFEIGVKRVFLREHDRNANPVIASVTWDGAPWAEGDVKEVSPCASATENRYDRCDGEKHTLAAHVTAESFESGVDERGAPFTEELVIQHYATEGIFEYDARVASSPDSGWVARAGASGKTVTIWLVARDDRGGMSWATRQVRVR